MSSLAFADVLVQVERFELSHVAVFKTAAFACYATLAKLVGMEGFELSTVAPQTRCSTKLSYIPIILVPLTGFKPVLPANLAESKL